MSEKEIERVNSDDAYELVLGLMVCAVRGSAQSVVNEHIDKYLVKQGEARVHADDALCRATKEQLANPCGELVAGDMSEKSIINPLKQAVRLLKECCGQQSSARTYEDLHNAVLMFIRQHGEA